MSRDDTIAQRPLPPRPKLGWLAWEATVAYIASQHSPDAVLRVMAQATGTDQPSWSATLVWGAHEEFVTDRQTLAAALRDLWREVAANHTIYRTELDAIKRPVNYRDDEWLDDKTEEALQRLIRVTRAVFQEDWQLMLIYQASDNPDMRTQARLLAQGHALQRGGRGATLRDACRTLYKNAASLFTSSLGRDE